MTNHKAEIDAIDCRHCGLSITRHEGIGGVQWRDNSHHSPSTCFKARNLVHEPEPHAEPRDCDSEACPNCTTAYVECEDGSCFACDDLYAALGEAVGPTAPPATSTPEEGNHV